MSEFLLKSQRLAFRTWSKRDLALAKELWGDPEVTRHIGGPFSHAEVEARLRAEMDSLERDGVQYWPVFELESGAPVGACGLRAKAKEPLTLELGFHLLRNQWNKGYATEAARRVIRHAFEELNVAALFAGHNPDNPDSARVLAKLGFRYSHDEHYAPTGRMHPSYLLTREEWATPR